MHIDDLRDLCLSLKGVEETLPFGPDNLVFKVMGKIFCIIAMDEVPMRCNVKCNPETALALREQYTGVLGGYHMDKKHWNTLVFDGTLPEGLVRQWVTDSHGLVAGSLPKRLRDELRSL